MEDQTEPKISRISLTLGTATIKFEGEQYIGHPVLDTRVTIEGKDLCWITWSDREVFISDLKEIILKYAI